MAIFVTVVTGKSLEDTNSLVSDTTNGNGPPALFAYPAQTLPITRDADLIACGAGPAGLSAAIVPASEGARVSLFEA